MYNYTNVVCSDGFNDVLKDSIPHLKIRAFGDQCTELLVVRYNIAEMMSRDEVIKILPFKVQVQKRFPDKFH